MNYLKNYYLAYFTILSMLLSSACGNHKAKTTPPSLGPNTLQSLVGIWVDLNEPLTSSDDISATRIDENGLVTSISAFPYREIEFGTMSAHGILNFTDESLKKLCDLLNEGFDYPVVNLSKLTFRFFINTLNELDEEVLAVEGPLVPPKMFERDDKIDAKRVDPLELDKLKNRAKNIEKEDKEKIGLLAHSKWELVEVIKTIDGEYETAVITPASKYLSYEFHPAEGEFKSRRHYNLKSIDFLDNANMLINGEHNSIFRLTNGKLFGFSETVKYGISDFGKITFNDNELTLETKSDKEDGSSSPQRTTVHKYRKQNPEIGFWAESLQSLNDDSDIVALKIAPDKSVTQIMAFPYEEIFLGHLRPDGTVSITKEAIQEICNSINSEEDGANVQIDSMTLKYSTNSKGELVASSTEVEGPRVPEWMINNKQLSVMTKITQSDFDTFKSKAQAIDKKDTEITRSLVSSKWKLIQVEKILEGPRGSKEVILADKEVSKNNLNIFSLYLT